MAKQNNNVIPIEKALNDVNYLARLRGALDRIAYTTHAKERMKERTISAQQVIQCLERGCIDEPAHLSPKGNWKATLRYFTSGYDVKVVAVIETNDKGDFTVVVTVFK